MRLFLASAFLLLIPFHLAGCGSGWKMDYAEPAAQFNAEDVAQNARPYLGKKVTVKGTLTKTDLTDPLNRKLYVADVICCNLGNSAQAQAYLIGQTVFIDGFLKRCQTGDVLLDPAAGRDPGANFNPVE